MCTRWEHRIKTSKKFSNKWITGSGSVSKDSVKKHVGADQHLDAIKLEQKSKMGAVMYQQVVVESSPIARGFQKLAEKDHRNMRIKFNSAYYLAKKERPFSDYKNLLDLQLKNDVPKFGTSYTHERAAANFTDYIANAEKNNLSKALSKARYYSVLNDGSTDTGVNEQELVYLLFLNEGTPTVKFLSIETPKTGDAAGIYESIKTSFARIGIMNFTDQLVGFNADCASVNMGKKKGVGTLIKQTAPWIEIVHCFNHRVELAIKDAFKGIKAFTDIDQFLLKLYYLYQKSPKRLRGLRNFAEALEESVPKPNKACGTRWIDHKYSAMKNVLDNYGIYIAHIEELCITDSQPEKRAELEGYLKRWKEASIPFNMAIYLDILSPIRRLALSMQAELHDPVKQIRRVKDFMLIMGKLKVFILDTLDGTSDIMTHHKHFTNEVIHVDGRYHYQNVDLKHYNRVINSAENGYLDVIVCIADSMEQRFLSVLKSSLFKNLVALLDVSTWPKTVDSASNFGDLPICEIVEEFEQLLAKNHCDTAEIANEWARLQSFINPIVCNNPKEYYLDIWKRVFTSSVIKEECGNILHVFEILLCTPFTIAKVERGFSRMSRVKSDFRSHLSRSRLDACLRISDEGTCIADFDPNPAIELWFKEKTRRLGSKQHVYPKKRAVVAGCSKDRDAVVDLATLCISDLEGSSEDEDEPSDDIL